MYELEHDVPVLLFQIDIHCLKNLNELPESSAVAVLNQVFQLFTQMISKLASDYVIINPHKRAHAVFDIWWK